MPAMERSLLERERLKILTVNKGNMRGLMERKEGVTERVDGWLLPHQAM